MYYMIESYDCQLSGISLLVRPLATNWPLAEKVWEKEIPWKENKVIVNKTILTKEIKLYI